MGFIRRMMGRRRPPPPQRKRPAVRRQVQASRADAVPPTADTLVLYALADRDARPAPGVDSLVLLDFDPVDVALLFEARPAPETRVDTADGLVARLDARLAGTRDPNSRGRVHFIRRWVADMDPACVGWRLEPAAVAGSGEVEPSD